MVARWVLAVIFCGSGGVALADSAVAWIERMRTAPERVEFQGILAHEHGTGVDSLRITRRAEGGVFVEEVQRLQGPISSVVRERDAVRCLRGSVQTSRVPRGPFVGGAGVPALEAAGLERVYRMRLGGVTSIAGRSVRQVTLRPRDDARYGYELWLDEATGLLLRADVLEGNGALRERFMFSEFQSFDVSDSPTGSASSEPSLGPAVLPPPKWSGRALPPGFQMVRYAGPKTDGTSTEHYVFSDGMTSISVFLEANPGSGAALESVHRVGAVSAVQRTVGGHLVTVVGEVPLPTILRVARGVTPDPR